MDNPVIIASHPDWPICECDSGRSLSIACAFCASNLRLAWNYPDYFDSNSQRRIADLNSNSPAN